MIYLIFSFLFLFGCNGGQTSGGSTISVGILPNEVFTLHQEYRIDVVAKPDIVTVMASFGMYEADSINMINGKGVFTFIPPEVGVDIPLTFIGLNETGKQIGFSVYKVTVSLEGNNNPSPNTNISYMIKNRFDLNAFSNNTTSLYGVHEVTFNGSPNDNVTINHNGKVVHAFYDGNGIMRARLYCQTIGVNTWTASTSLSGSFEVIPSLLNGKLRTSGTKFITDSGKSFGTMIDTQYPLTHDKTSFNLFASYLMDIAKYGVTVIRTGVAGVFGYMKNASFDDKNKIKRYYNGNEFNYKNFQADDKKLQWALRNYPDMQFQLVLYGGPSDGYTRNDTLINNLGYDKRIALLKYMMSRYAAYPNVIFLIYNDANYTAMNTKLAAEALKYLMNNDVYVTARATGGMRNKSYNSAFLNGLSTYVHLETEGDLSASKIGNYGLPTFTYEDLYEGLQRDRHNSSVLFSDPSYFFRRLQWSWVLSGGGASYGNKDYFNTHVYSHTSLKGLHHIKFVWSFFEALKLDINTLARDFSSSNGTNGENRVQAAQSERYFIAYNPIGNAITIHPDFIGMQFSIYNPSNGVFTPWSTLYDNVINPDMKDYVIVIKRW